MPRVCVEVTGTECRECFNVEKRDLRLNIEHLLITVQGTTSGLNRELCSDSKVKIVRILRGV